MSSSAYNEMKQPSHPLTEAEVRQAGGLLMRAVKHGQTASISKFMLVTNEKRSIVAAASHFVESVPEVLGSMTDGSKRRRDLEDPDESLSCQEWDKISDVGGDNYYSPKKSGGKSLAYSGPVTYSGGGGYLATPMPGNHQPSGVDQGEDITVPIPEDNVNSADWGQTICKLDKVVARRLRYSEMVVIAKSDGEMNRYLNYIQGRFGKNAKSKVTNRITGGVDLANYLDRIRWTPSAVEYTFQREK